ncbi:hypothetical protein AB0F95_22480 [Micromonospora tulbaghiae]|uniref:hypothetical protein n=1 Tax=Micromonospora tulbaghiae TaxID=479978 RepID=UPI0033C2379C
MEPQLLASVPSSHTPSSWEAHVVHDDDMRSAQTVWISADDEPIEVISPDDEETFELILDTALDNPHWDRLTIFEYLVRTGNDVLEEEVNYVLWERRLDNLFPR